MDPVTAWLTLAIGFVVLTAISVLSPEIVRRRVAKRLEPEGIKLRSGPTFIRAVMLGRPWNPALPGELILTRLALTIVAGAVFRLEADDLAQLSLRYENGRLYLSTAHPPRAAGLVEADLAVSDGPAWLAALSERGAKAASTPAPVAT